MNEERSSGAVRGGADGEGSTGTHDRARRKESGVKKMGTTILGRKLGMSQVWSEDDRLIPVTVIEAGPCFVSQVKTKKKDGYDAVQLAFGEMDARKATKPVAGHFAKAKLDPDAPRARDARGRGRLLPGAVRRSPSTCSTSAPRSM